MPVGSFGLGIARGQTTLRKPWAMLKISRPPCSWPPRVALGVFRLEFGDDAGGDRTNHQQQQETRGRHRQRQSAPLLPDFLRKQILFRHAVDGGGEVGAEIEKAVVARIEASRDRY